MTLRRVAVPVLVAATAAIGALNLKGAASELNQARIHATSLRAGTEYCVKESLGGGKGPGLSVGMPYIDWLRSRLPAGAVYEAAPHRGPPDAWCLTLLLLPALPAGPGGTPGWTITLGAVPASLRSAVARHERNVQEFAPGFVLARGVPR